jgi:ADP-ribosylglycohydrolase
MTTHDPTRDRCRGALLGLATGDALGTTLEFTTPGTFEPLTDIVGSGSFGLEPGQWTDDTSLALCLAESLTERGGFDPADQLERYVRWWRDGHMSSTGECFDIGNQTSTALAAFERSHAPQPLPPGSGNAGNGSIMRLAPVPIAYHDDVERAIEQSGRSSLTTHPAEVCVDACRYLGALTTSAINGATKDELLARHFWQWGALHPRIETIARGSFHTKEPPDIKGGGYVVDSLEAALWALDRSRDFRHGALLAVNLGDDADTTGAVYGQLAGAVYGATSIAAEWRDTLTMRELIEDLADRLILVATNVRSRPTCRPAPTGRTSVETAWRCDAETNRTVPTLGPVSGSHPRTNVQGETHMVFPTRTEILKALLAAFADGATHYSDDVEAAVADILELSESQRLARAGNGSRLGNEIDWIKGAGDQGVGFFERVGPKRYRLTPHGRSAAAGNIDLDHATRTIRGRVNPRSSDLDELLDDDVETLRNDPNNIPALNRTGRRYQERGETAKAIDMFERVLALDPTNTIAARRIRELQR